MDEAERRKAASEDLLAAQGVSINPHLPMIEPEAETRLRTPQDATRRMLALLAVAAVASGVDRSEVVDWLKAEDLWSAVSGRETRFLTDTEPSDQDRMNASWNVECAWCLGWALNLIGELGLPTQEATPRHLLDLVPGPGDPTGDFVAEATLRPKAEILDASDLIYRAHWAARDASLGEGSTTGPIDRDVAMEWHKSINWLTWHSDEEDWDEVTTDT